MKVQLEFTCGEKTCAISPGKFCRFVSTTHFGTRHICLLFPAINRQDQMPLPLQEADGWLHRCPECLALSGTQAEV